MTHPEDRTEREESATTDCPECGKPVYEDADRCPSCGNYIVRGEARRSPLPGWMVLGIIVALAFLLWLALSG